MNSADTIEGSQTLKHRNILSHGAERASREFNRGTVKNRGNAVAQLVEALR
jgi:hypothetical protein